MKTKLVVSLLAVFLTAFVSVSVSLAQAVEPDVIKFEKFTVYGKKLESRATIIILPPESSYGVRITVRNSEVIYDVPLAEEPSFVRLVAHRGGGLMRISVSYDGGWIQKFHIPDGEWVSETLVVETKGIGLDPNQWATFFQEKIKPVIVDNSDHSIKFETIDDQKVVWEIDGQDKSVGGREFALKTVVGKPYGNVGVYRSVADSDFGVLPRAGTKFRLAATKGLLFPVETVIVDGKELQVVVFE